MEGWSSHYVTAGPRNLLAVYAHLPDPVLSLDRSWILAVMTAKMVQAPRRIAVNDVNEPK